MSELETNTPDDDLPEGEGSRFMRAHHILMYFLAAALVVWLLSGFYQVKADQIAIIERLGQFVKNSEGTSAAQIEHGLHYHLPWPIDRVHVVSTQQAFVLPVTMFNASPEQYGDFKLALRRSGASDTYLNAIFDPYLITGDKCVVHVQVTVQFHIDNPESWLMSVSHDYSTTYDVNAAKDMRNQLFQHIAQQVMVQRVGRMSLDGVLRDQRDVLQRELLAALQDGMNIPDPADPTGVKMISLGAQIMKVEIGDDKVPDAVVGYYNDLINQRARADTVRNNARADAESATNKAKGEMTTLIVNAQQYAQTTVRAAEGEAARFSQILEQYNNAPDITRFNVFADAVRSVAGSAKRIIFARPGQPTTIVVDPAQIDTGQGQPK